jgi:hypothetical protein
VATAEEVKDVYELEVDSRQHDQQKCFVTENTHPDKNVHNSQELRHRQSAHLNTGDMLKLKQKNCGVYFSRTKNTINCEPCQSGKITRNPFHASSSHATAWTADENVGELRKQLNAADSRIEELEKELLKVHQQMLDHLSDFQ